MAIGLRAQGVLSVLLGTGCLLLRAPPVLAQTPPDHELPEVVSEGQAEPEDSAEAKDPTSFATSVPKRAGEGERVADLARAAPGVLVRDYGLNQPATVSLRGSSADQVMVLLDGIPLNSSAGGGLDLSTLPAALVERAEVVRGAVGARYGAGAVGGVLSLQTRRPLPGERSWFGELSYGSFGTAEVATGVAGALGERVTALGSAFAYGSDGDFPYSYAERPTSAPDERTPAVRANNQARRFGGLARLSFTGEVEGDVLVEADGGERGVPGSYRFPTSDLKQEDQRALLGSRIAFGAAGLRFEGRLGGRLGRLRLGTWAEAGDPQDEALLDAGFSASGLFGRHAVELGLTGGREWLSSTGHGAPARSRLGVYAADEFTWRWLTVVPALRFERVGRDDGWSPKLGASAAVGEHVALKANAGRSFRSPSFGELYLESGLLIPNPELVPETGTYVDLGPEVRWAGLTVSAAGFWGLYDDIIVYELYPPRRARPYNLGRAEVWGGELEALFHRGPLDLSAAYTLTFSANRYDDPRFLDKELPYRPRHRLHARASATYWRLAGHVDADLQSEQFTNRSNTTTQPGWARVDVGASVVLDRSLGLSLHAEFKNLLDSSDEDLYAYPLPGRSFHLAVRFDSTTRSTP